MKNRPKRRRQEYEGKDKWILETGLCSYVGACRFYMGLADDIEIVDSPEFQDYVDKFIADYLPKGDSTLSR